MKAPDFLYERPGSVAEAMALLADSKRDCLPLAGGQSLMPMMNLRLAQPETLVDLNALSELDFIEQREQQTHIGAMVRYTTLQNSALVRKQIPLLSLALPHIAHQAVRNRGTIGGSTALADPAAEIPAVLKALNATVVTISNNGQRNFAADEFFQGIYETALNDNELVHSIIFPQTTEQHRFGFYELARRQGDYAMAGVAISAASTSPYADLRIVFFGIADQPLRATDAEAALNGSEPDDAAVLFKAQQSLPVDEFLDAAGMSVKTRLQLAQVALKRALQSL